MKYPLAWKYRLPDWYWHVHTSDTVYKVENQGKPTVQLRELYLVLCCDLNGKEIFKKEGI